MMVIEYISAGLFFLFIFLSGFWLNRAARPYSTLIITIHKLIALGLGIFLGWTVYQPHQAAPLAVTQLVLVAVTILLFAVNVATGSLLSTNKAMPGAVSFLNKWIPYLTVIATATILYLLLYAN